jgi:hypothetical protein
MSVKPYYVEGKCVKEFEESIFGRILDSKMDKLTGRFRKLNYYELHYLHTTQYLFMMIK